MDMTIENITKNQRDVSIIIEHGLEYDEIEKSLDGRATSIKIDGNIRLINLYVPSGQQNKRDREAFFENTLGYQLRLNNEEYIIGGDFNCVLEKKIGKKSIGKKRY